jgi:hypothetical protein
MPAMRQVTSSTVKAVGHDPETNELHVEWLGHNRTSVYSGVDAEKAKTVMNSWSIGKALNDLVKPHHGHVYK